MQTLVRMTRALVGPLALAALSQAASAQNAGPTAARPLAGAMVRSVMMAYDEGNEQTTVTAWRARIGNDEAKRALLSGTLAVLAYRYDEAERHLQRAARDTADPTATYASLLLANLAASRSQYGEAITQLQRQKPRLVMNGDVSALADLLINEAGLVLRTTGIEAANARLREAEALLPADDPWIRSRHACAVLQVRVRAANAIADSTWDRALGEAARVGPRVYADCLFARAQRVEASGRADRALTLFDTLATVQRRARLIHGLSATLQWQGSTLLSRSRYAEARVALEEALAAARTSHSRLSEAWATRELGRIAQRLGASTDSDALLLAARRIFLEAGDETGVLLADRVYAEGLLLRGQLARADSAFEGYRSRGERLDPTTSVAALVARADIARQQRRHEAGHQLLDTASTLAALRGMTGWNAEIRYQRGTLLLSSGEYRGAVAQWDTLLRATRAPRGPGRFELLARWAEAVAARGDLDAAWQHINTGLREFDRYRASLSRREDLLASLQDRAFDWDRDLGLTTLVSYFALNNRAAEGLAIAEWRRVRAREQVALQRGALSVDATGHVRVVVVAGDSGGVDPSRLPALARTRIAPSHAVVSFIVGHGGEPTTAFVLTRDTLVSVALVAIDSVANDIERFSALLQGGRLSESLSQKLGSALLAPLLQRLPSHITRLVIVPDGELHRLPFAALTHPAGGPLLAHYELAIAPSVEDALGGVSAAPRRNSSARSVVLSAPNQMPVIPGSTERFGALPGARSEARAVATQLAGATLLDGRNATRDRLVRAIGNGGQVLHVATHAVADPESFARNGLAIQASAGADGLFTLDNLSAQPLPFDLVVFSTCSSGDGVLLVGQSLHGLVATALDAGARGVVATRWRVEDATMGALVAPMYEAIAGGDDVVTALHRVRVQAMRSGASPALWANLEYFGDPSLRLRLETRRPSAWARLTGAVRRWLPW